MSILASKPISELYCLYQEDSLSICPGWSCPTPWREVSHIVRLSHCHSVTMSHYCHTVTSDDWQVTQRCCTVSTLTTCRTASTASSGTRMRWSSTGQQLTLQRFCMLLSDYYIIMIWYCRYQPWNTREKQKVFDVPGIRVDVSVIYSPN